MAGEAVVGRVSEADILEGGSGAVLLEVAPTGVAWADAEIGIHVVARGTASLGLEAQGPEGRIAT